MGGLQQREGGLAEFAKRVQHQQQQHDRFSRPEAFTCNVCGLNFRSVHALQQHVDYLGHHVAATLQRPALRPYNEPMELSARIEAPQEHKQESAAYVLTSHGSESDVLMEDNFETLSVAQSAAQSLHSTGHPQDLTGRSISFQCTQCNQTFRSEDAVATHKDRAHTNNFPVDYLPVNSLQVYTDDSLRAMQHDQHDLHDALSQRLDANGVSLVLYEEGQPKDSILDYDTSVTGAFVCPKLSCPASRWTSSRIGITIRMYEHGRYNVTVWHQRCRKCETLGVAQLDAEVYIERVAYRLCRWLGLKVEIRPIPFSRRVLDYPHESKLCEGCKNGHCPIPKDDPEDY